MLEITKAIEWDMGHRIPNHKSKCRNPHGHRYRLEVTVAGPVSKEKGASHEGMVHDFGDIKEHLMSKVHALLDHCFLASEEDGIFAPLAQNEALGLKIILVPFIPTAENILIWCYKLLTQDYPAQVPMVRLRLFETPTSFVEFVPPHHS